MNRSQIVALKPPKLRRKTSQRRGSLVSLDKATAEFSQALKASNLTVKDLLQELKTVRKENYRRLYAAKA